MILGFVGVMWYVNTLANKGNGGGTTNGGGVSGNGNGTPASALNTVVSAVFGRTETGAKPNWAGYTKGAPTPATGGEKVKRV
jgi:hypothetical protein